MVDTDQALEHMSVLCFAVIYDVGSDQAVDENFIYLLEQGSVGWLFDQTVDIGQAVKPTHMFVQSKSFRRKFLTKLRPLTQFGTFLKNRGNLCVKSSRP